MAVLQGVFSTIFLAFLVFGIYQLSTDDQVSFELKEQLINETGKNPVFALLFVKTLDDLTPTIGYDLPFTEKKIYLINEFPLYSWTHFVFTFLLLAVAGVILRWSKASKWKMLGVFVILIFVGYIIGSILLVVGYNISAKELGFEKQEKKDFREQYNQHFNDVATPLIIFSLFVFLNVLRIVLVKVKDG